MKALKYIVILILSVFFVEAAYAQKVSSGIGEDLYYKNGRLYQDGQKLTKTDIKATFSPEAYRQYANGRRLYQSGLALTITGGGFVGVSGAASGSVSPVIAFGALDNGFGLALKF